MVEMHIAEGVSELLDHLTNQCAKRLITSTDKEEIAFLMGYMNLAVSLKPIFNSKEDERVFALNFDYKSIKKAHDNARKSITETIMGQISIEELMAEIEKKKKES